MKECSRELIILTRNDAKQRMYFNSPNTNMIVTTLKSNLSVEDLTLINKMSVKNHKKKNLSSIKQQHLVSKFNKFINNKKRHYEGAEK